MNWMRCGGGATSPNGSPRLYRSTGYGRSSASCERGRHPLIAQQRRVRVRPGRSAMIAERPTISELQLQPAEALDRIAHQHVLLGLVLRQVRHREAQERAGVVPRHAADRLLRDEE